MAGLLGGVWCVSRIAVEPSVAWRVAYWAGFGACLVVVSVVAHKWFER